MTRRSLPLVERLRQGLTGAVLSAAALAAPAAEAVAPLESRLAQADGAASRPATRGQASKTPNAKTPKTTLPKPSPASRTKPPVAGKGAVPAAGGCGAHDGGCGPSR